MARLDTLWHADPKVIQLGFSGMGLHAWSISYCDYVRSDGFVPEGAWPSLPGAHALVKSLVTAGLWEPVQGGYQVHHFTKYNRSRAEIEAEQDGWRARQSRSRSRGMSRVTEGVTEAVSNGVTLARAGAPGPGPGPGVTLKRDTRNSPTPLPDPTADAQGPLGTASAPSTAQTCPMCNRVFIGAYSEHHCAISRPPARGGMNKLFGRRSDLSPEEIDQAAQELAEYRRSLAAQPVESAQ